MKPWRHLIYFYFQVFLVFTILIWSYFILEIFILQVKVEVALLNLEGFLFVCLFVLLIQKKKVCFASQVGVFFFFG